MAQKESAAKQIKKLSGEFLKKVAQLRAQHDKEIARILDGVHKKKIEEVRNKLKKI